MSSSLQRGRTVLATLLATAWVVVCMPPGVHAVAWSIVPLTAFGIALLFRAPAIGAVVVLLAAALCPFVGVPYTETEMLLPTLGTLFWLGRRCRGWWLGFLFSWGFATATAFREGAELRVLPLAGAVYATAWVFGLMIRRRSIAARRAAARASALAETDLERLVSTSAFAERRRITGSVLRELRSAIREMNRLAVSSGSSHDRVIDPELVRGIRERGERAVAALHGILQLLRSSPVAPLAPTTAVATDGPRHRRTTIANALIAGSGIIICTTTILLTAPGRWQLVPLAVGFPVCAVLAKRFPFAMNLGGCAVYACASFSAPFDPNALLPIGFIYHSLLIWNTSVRWSVGTVAGLALSGTGALGLAWQFGRPGVAAVLALIALSTVTAHAWRDKDRILLAEQERSAQLSAAIAAAKLRADAIERQRVAGELHDGISYALTAMTMQAQAALAQQSQDPSAARASMRLVREIGT